MLLTDAFTAPAFRNKGVHTALAIAGAQLAFDLGYKRLICYIDSSNAPSLSVWQRKLQAQVVNRLDFKRMGIWRMTRSI
jgi:hypothetical protein